MGYLIVLGVIVFSVAQMLFARLYTQKVEVKNNGFFFSFVKFVTVFLFLGGMFLFERDFDWGVIPYALLFGIITTIATVSSYLAIQWGPLSAMALVSAYSLLIPTFYGILFLGEPMNALKGVALVVCAVCILLFNFPQKKKENEDGTKPEKKKIFKWLIALAVAFVSNGFCSVVQNMQQTAFDGRCKTAFLLVAALFISVAMLVCSLATERKTLKQQMNKVCVFSLLAGIAYAATNLLVLVLFVYLDVSIAFPVISVGTLAVSLLAAIVFFKEKLTKIQFVAFCITIVNILLFNI